MLDKYKFIWYNTHEIKKDQNKIKKIKGDMYYAS